MRFAPLAAALAEPEIHRATRWALGLLVVAPMVLVVVVVQHWLIRILLLRQPLDILVWSPLIQALSAAALGALVLDVMRRRQMAPRTVRE
ncbi:MAG: hypothetical protein M3336_02535, partial [Chloroflexota bacterium]|nr:hypothetical protein [Chloroflexota bacterium]